MSTFCGILRDSKLSNEMNFLQIRFGHLKLASVTPGLSNSCKLRFKSNIAGIYKIDIYCVVEDITRFDRYHFRALTMMHHKCKSILQGANITMSFF